MGLLPIAAALLLTPNAMTPEGPATLRATFVGPVPHARFGPRVVVRWRVEVGEGSAAGPVALRVLRGDPMTGDAFGRGAVEQLPATPGAHEFPARLRILDGQVLGLDQQTGGHAIVTTDAHPDDAVDVWRPPLGVNEARRDFERRPGERLLISPTFELDVDGDGYGDKTQDENDLAISARPARRSIFVRVRNRGDRTVDNPRLLIRLRGARLLTRTHARPERPVPPGYRYQTLPHIPPGAVRSVRLHVSRSGYRAKLIAESEGFDPTRAALVVRGRSG